MLNTYIYIIYSEYTSTIKVGYSKNPIARLLSLQTGCPHRLNLYSMFLGTLENEQELHKLLHHYRQDGEWFVLCSEALEIIGKFQLTLAENTFNLIPDPYKEIKKSVQTICKEYLANSKTRRRIRVPQKFLRDNLNLPLNEIKVIMESNGYSEVRDKSKTVYFYRQEV